jgi:hypothetical protein
MNRLRLLTTVTLIAGLLVLVITLLDLLAVTDINRDYVSQSVLEDLNIALSRELPEWTGTRSEWQFVAFSIYSRVGFLILNSIALWLCRGRFKHLEDIASQRRQDEREVPFSA